MSPSNERGLHKFLSANAESAYLVDSVVPLAVRVQFDRFCVAFQVACAPGTGCGPVPIRRRMGAAWRSLSVVAEAMTGVAGCGSAG